MQLAFSFSSVLVIYLWPDPHKSFYLISIFDNFFCSFLKSEQFCHDGFSRFVRVFYCQFC